MIDSDGVLCSVSGKPGQWGHSLDDYHWYCSIDGAVAENDNLRSVIRGLLLSADCTWETSGGGHDWPETCEAARAALGEGSNGE